NSAYTKAKELTFLFDQLLDAGVPGIGVSIYSPEGWWGYTGGYAQLETQTPMQPCHLHYTQSISKTYLGVVILKLHEEGRLDLDESIRRYLPIEYSKLFPRASEITVRMLLRHSSGLPEYNTHPVNITQLLQTPEKFFTLREYMEVVEDKPLDFEPDTGYSYRNLNFMLLALIADAITGDHAQYMDKVIFQPLGLEGTFYRSDSNYPNYPLLCNSYWDRHSDGILENVSQMQRTNVASMVGDDGILCTTADAVRFLRGLLEGELLKPATLEMMYQGYELENGRTEYGLGLDHAIFDNHPAYGHSGGGLGAGCQLYYLPHNETYFFVVINIGTITEGAITDAASPILEEIHKVLSK
ncbi:MAG: serine hydrolase domain-containing protein, partial [Bacteroidota bacterium]